MLWPFLLSLTIVVNLVSYQKMDLFFVLFFCLAIDKTHIKTNPVPPLYPIKTEKLLNCLLALLFGSVSIATLLHSPNISEALKEIFNLRWVLGFYAAIYAGYRFQNDTVEKTSRWPFLLIFLTGVLIAYAFHPERDFVSFERRLIALYENPNHLALALIIPWSFLLGYIAHTKKKFTLSLCSQLLTLLAMSIVLFFTYSRTAWLAMLFIMLGVVVITRSKKLMWIGFTSIITIFTLCYFDLFWVRERILYSFNFSPDSAQSTRILAWKVGWHIFQENPFLGVGFENIHTSYKIAYQKLGIPDALLVGHSHNEFLQILLGAGLIGLIAYTSILAAGLKYFFNSFRNSPHLEVRKVAFGAFLVIISIVLCSITDTPLRIHEGRNYILLILGISLGYIRHQEYLGQKAGG